MTDDLTAIGDIADVYDGPHATPDKTGNGPYFLNIASLEKGRLDLTKSAHLSEVDFVRWTRRVTPEQGDILFSYETRLGEAALMPPGIKACLGRRMGLLRPKQDKVIPEYLLYAYIAPQFQKEIAANTIKGATVERISISEIGKFPIRVPELAQQKKIAAVLSAVDAKIALNNRLNAELQALAKTIYDYWFVQFDFPDEKGRPYKASGGRMVYNEALGREIPEGWEAKRLSDIVSTSTASVDPSAAPDRLFRHVSIPSYDATGSYQEEYGRDIGSNKFTVRSLDVLVSKLNPRFSRVVADTSYDDLICSTEFVIWRCDNEATKAYLETVATHAHFITHCTQSASSTSGSHKRVNPDVMMRYELPYSSERVEKYGRFAAPILAKRIINSREARELTQLRDWLLPLLMGGQVKVI
jgi:type I restriction enzyme S subunit